MGMHPLNFPYFYGILQKSHKIPWEIMGKGCVIVHEGLKGILHRAVGYFKNSSCLHVMAPFPAVFTIVYGDCALMDGMGLEPIKMLNIDTMLNLWWWRAFMRTLPKNGFFYLITCVMVFPWALHSNPSNYPQRTQELPQGTFLFVQRTSYNNVRTLACLQNGLILTPLVEMLYWHMRDSRKSITSRWNVQISRC